MIPLSLVLVACFVIAAWVLIQGKLSSKYPPGPRGVPLFGNLFQVGPRMHLILKEWAKTYGSIFSIRLGMEKIVVLDDYKLMKEMFNDPAFSGRPQSEIFLGLSEGSYGIINTEGKVWEEQRRYLIRHLRDFGFGKNYMENLILDEVKELLEWLKKEEGKPLSLNRKLALAVLNSLWSITCGKRFAQNDPTLTNMLDNATKVFNSLTESGILLFAPWIKHISPSLSGWNKLQVVVGEMSSFFKQTVQEHRENYNGDHIRDFVDHYIQEIKSTENPASSFYGEKGIKHLNASVGDLFQAGSETTSTTLVWAILYLTIHPKVMKKLQEEIDAVVGNSRLPNLQDRASMPYTESVIYEVLRVSSLVPTGVFHRALETKEFHGYTIPKGAWIIGNLYSVHNNKEIWGDPEVFRPERFLSQDGKTSKQHDALLPFQIGKRVCLGQQLAKDTIFLFMVSIFQRFNVSYDSQKIDLQPDIGFLLAPKPFNVILKERI